MEIEAKFSIPDCHTFDQLQKLLHLNQLAGYRLASQDVQQIQDRYLDTKDRALLRVGYACRMRQTGAARTVAVKAIGRLSPRPGVHCRVEHQVPVQQDDPAAWPDSEVRQVVLQHTQGTPLQELFALYQERHKALLYQLDSDGEGRRPVAELSLDAVSPHPGAETSYYELELELLERGTPSDLEMIANELRTTWELAPEPRSKFERELMCLDAAARKLDKKSPDVLAGDAMSEAGRKVLWLNFQRMLYHAPGTRAGQDIEALHDMRVATRRMRAAMRVFGEYFEPPALRPFDKDLRRVARALGPVRDLDVFEAKAQKYLKTLPPENRDGLAPLREAWHQEREVAREKMLAFLDGSRYLKFTRAFARFLQTPRAGALPPSRDPPRPYLVRHVAPRLIYTRYEAVRAYEMVLPDAPVETLHALRIEFKYLRYTFEFLQEALGPEARAVIKELKGVQDHLGDLNDADVAIDILNNFLAQEPAVADLEGIQAYLAFRKEEKARLIAGFPEVWDRFNRDQARRWLARSVAVL